MTRIRFRAAAFAAAVASRHARRAVGRRIGLPLAAPARVSMPQVVHRHTRFGDVLHTRLQMHLHVHRSCVTHRAAVASRTAATSPRLGRAGRGPDFAVLSSPRTIISDRLPQRARRHEVVRPQPAPVNPFERSSDAAPSAAPFAAPMRAMPLARSASRISTTRDHQPAPAGDTGARDERTMPATARATARATRPAPPASPSVVDGEIERLADRVIGSIDRRIAAQRERLGRF